MSKKSKCKFPTIVKALEILCNDSGCIVNPKSLFRWNDELPKIEKALSKLDTRHPQGDFSELETFVIGETSDQTALVKKYPALKTAHKFLDAVFHAGG